MKNMLGIVSVVAKRPACLENRARYGGEVRWSAFRIKLKSRERGENIFKKKIALLRGELIGKGNRVGEGDRNGDSRGELSREQARIGLEERSFDALAGCLEKRQEQGKKKNTCLSHLKNISTDILEEAINPNWS
jgi:hypothetical protein